VSIVWDLVDDWAQQHSLFSQVLLTGFLLNLTFSSYYLHLAQSLKCFTSCQMIVSLMTLWLIVSSPMIACHDEKSNEIKVVSWSCKLHYSPLLALFVLSPANQASQYIHLLFSLLFWNRLTIGSLTPYEYKVKDQFLYEYLVECSPSCLFTPKIFFYDTFCLDS